MFDKVLYQGSLDGQHQLSIEPLHLKNETFSEDIVYNLIGSDSKLFSIRSILNVITITLAGSLSEDELDGRRYLTTTIIASRPAVDSGSAVILVDIPPTPAPPPPIPVPLFQKSLYRGQLDVNLKLQDLEPISIRDDTYTDNVIFTLEGDDSSWFSWTRLSNELTISLDRQITDDDVDSKNYLTFTIVAKNDIGNSSDTVVLINVPEKMCPECPTTTTIEPTTCPPEIVCPTCPTTTEPPPPSTQTPVICPECPPTLPPLIVDYTPRFENRYYEFWVKPHVIGTIGSTLARVEADDAIDVKYSLDINDGKAW